MAPNPLVVWLMYNPSIADARKDDPTIRKVIGFSNRWGFQRLDVYNAFAFRSPHPSQISRFKDPIGPLNHEYLKQIPYDVPVIAAWGGLLAPGYKKYVAWWEEIGQMLMARNTFCLGRCANGKYPRHPLMLPYSTERVKF